MDAVRMAALAKLELTGEELDRAARELDAILGYFEALDAIDTAGDAPTETVAPAARLRSDEPVPPLDAADTFRNAPDADLEAGLFRVPRVLGS